MKNKQLYLVTYQGRRHLARYYKQMIGQDGNPGFEIRGRSISGSKVRNIEAVKADDEQSLHASDYNSYNGVAI